MFYISCSISELPRGFGIITIFLFDQYLRLETIGRYGNAKWGGVGGWMDLQKVLRFRYAGGVRGFLERYIAIWRYIQQVNSNHHLQHHHIFACILSINSSFNWVLHFIDVSLPMLNSERYMGEEGVKNLKITSYRNDLWSLMGNKLRVEMPCFQCKFWNTHAQRPKDMCQKYWFMFFPKICHTWIRKR